MTMSNNIIEEYRKPIKHGEAVLRIHQDFDPHDPREMYDHNTVMVCWHSRYDLGDKHDFSEPDDFIEFIEGEPGGVYLPLYLYDHSGITMSVGRFSCPWDSGQVGYIYTTDAHLVSMGHGGVHPIPDHDTLLTWLRQDVEEYDNYLTGEVYGFTYHEEIRVNPAGDIEERNEDSCYGFNYSNWDEMILGMLEHCEANPTLEEWVCQ